MRSTPLALRVRDRDVTMTEDGYARVFADHGNAMMRLAYVLLGDDLLAEDVVAEAFAKAYGPWQRGRVADERAYLRRAVVNGANSRLRRRYLERRERTRRTGDDRGARLIDESTAERDEIWRALVQLPVRQRQVVVLRFYEDLPEAMIAEHLGVSVGTVKSSLSRGLARLRELVAADASQGGER